MASGVNGVVDGHNVHVWAKNFPNHAETERQGRPVMRTVPWFHAKPLAHAQTVVVGALRERHREMWPDLIAAFEREQTGKIDGTPLTELGWLNHTRMAELRAAGIVTVEHLAGLGESPEVRKYGPLVGQEAVRAQAWLDGDGEVEAMKAANKGLELKLSTLEAQVAGLIASQSTQAVAPVAAAPLQAPEVVTAAVKTTEAPKRRPGRPPRPKAPEAEAA